jgi:hypothetical protein
VKTSQWSSSTPFEMQVRRQLTGGKIAAGVGGNTARFVEEDAYADLMSDQSAP